MYGWVVLAEKVPLIIDMGKSGEISHGAMARDR